MKLLLAVDGSEYSAKAVDYLASKFNFAKDNVSVHVVNVRLPVPNAQGRPAALANQNEIDAYNKEEAQAALNPAENALRNSGYSVTSSYAVGDIAQEINNIAREKKSDLIVMGSHGRGALKNLVLGSVATKVLALSDVPVLIVR